MLQLVLADLAGTEVSLAAFGARAADSAEALALGCVVAVVGASAKRRGATKNSSSSSSSAPLFSLSAGDAAVLLPLGPSADYGTCGARTRDGGSCRRAVNKSECPVCDLHVSAVASRLRPGAGQGALRDSALSAHVLGNSKRRADGSGGGFFFGSGGRAGGDDSSSSRAAARAAAADAALGLPQAREAAAIASWLTAEGATAGYADYFTALATTYNTPLIVRTLEACKAPSVHVLCRGTINTRDAWYARNGRARTFIIVNRGTGNGRALAAALPHAHLPHPVATRQFGDIDVLVYRGDITIS